MMMMNNYDSKGDLAEDDHGKDDNNKDTHNEDNHNIENQNKERKTRCITFFGGFSLGRMSPPWMTGTKRAGDFWSKSVSLILEN